MCLVSARVQEFVSPSVAGAAARSRPFSSAELFGCQAASTHERVSVLAHSPGLRIKTTRATTAFLRFAAWRRAGIAQRHRAIGGWADARGRLPPSGQPAEKQQRSTRECPWHTSVRLTVPHQFPTGTRRPSVGGVFSALPTTELARGCAHTSRVPAGVHPLGEVASSLLAGNREFGTLLNTPAGSRSCRGRTTKPNQEQNRQDELDLLHLVTSGL